MITSASPAPGDGARPFAAELESAGRSLDEAGAVLRHLLDGADRSLFADRVVAQVRAMIEHVASQLPPDRSPDSLLAQPRLVAHAQALALEAELAERLADRLALDPVLPPLIQAETAAPDPERATAALALLGAQARFVQAQRRGELPLGELPEELLDDALPADLAATVRERRAAAPERRALLAKFADAPAALELEHAGVALFLTALARGAGFDRDEAVLATTRSQLPRLVVALAAAGASRAAIERQVLTLHPDAALPADLPDAVQATALLARGESLLG